MLKTILKYPLSLLLAAAITYLSLMDVPEVDLGEVPFFDKWVHFVMYGSLAAMLYIEKVYSLYKAKALPWISGITSTHLLMFSLIPSLLGGLLEILQANCTNGHRSGDWLDFYADVFGVAIITTIVIILKKVL